MSSVGETIKSFIKDETASFLENKAVGLIASYGNMLEKMSPKQKEYVKKVAVLKAAETSELTFDEILELGEVLNECQKLQIEISAELSSFWSKIGDISKEVSLNFAQVGMKVAAKALVGYLPI